MGVWLRGLGCGVLRMGWDGDEGSNARGEWGKREGLERWERGRRRAGPGFKGQEGRGDEKGKG